MKKALVVVLLVLVPIRFIVADAGAFLETGLGYNYDTNAGLGFNTTSKGAYIGAGAGFGYFGEVSWMLGVNIDFLIKPEISFVRGEEHYKIENIVDTASFRVMPYLEISKAINDWIFTGLGLGYAYDRRYFDMHPLLYDSDYTSYMFTSHSLTPVFFLRAYFGQTAFYLSLNYEVDMVLKGSLERLAGDPLADFADIDGSGKIDGVHHRARIVLGYFLGGMWY